MTNEAACVRTPLPTSGVVTRTVTVSSGAMLSHETAAEVHGIIDKPVGSSIHVTVPLRRRPTQHRPTRGIIIHRSNQSQQLFLGPFKLPRTRIEDTVLDLVAAAPTFDHAYSWIARSVFKKRVTAEALRAALAARARIRWREWLKAGIPTTDEKWQEKMLEHNTL